jgi:hypothetical protein
MSEENKCEPLAEQLRSHARKDTSIAWESQARMLMKWAAETIDAANAAITSAPKHTKATPDA